MKSKIYWSAVLSILLSSIFSLDAYGATQMPQTNWKLVSADSQELVGDDGATTKAMAINVLGDLLSGDQVVPDWTSVTQAPFPLYEPQSIVNPVLRASDVTDIQADFVADPFIFHEAGIWYMFFEVNDSATGYGRIGLARSSDGLNWTYDRIVLQESWHLSYPYVFKYNGRYFLIPETSQKSEVRVYEAMNFPYDWEYAATLVSGRDFVDPSVFFYNGKWWMFVSDTTNSNCYLFYSNNLLSGWIQHPLSPIVSNDASKARPAGRAFAYNGNKIIRTAQKNDVTYGEQVRVFQVDTLSENYYAEHEIPESPILTPSNAGVWSAPSKSDWNSWGMHQFDPWWTGSEWICAVDGLAATYPEMYIGILSSTNPLGPITPIPHAGWVLKYVDSQELVGEDGAATNAFDGNPDTFWHTQWVGSNPPCPHELQIDLGLTYNIFTFRYLPRQDGGMNGRIGQYEFYMSADGVSWGSPVAKGTFANNVSEKQVSFAPKTGRFIALKALSEVNGNPWTSMAEINLLSVPYSGGALTVSPTSVTGGTASQGTVILSSAAPNGGAVVQLSSDTTSAATVPASVTVASGATIATFTITTTPVVSSTSVTISASYDGVTNTATLTVNPPALSTLTVSPTSVTGGTSSVGTVTLSGPAPSGGVVVQLGSDNTSISTVPATVTVANGNTSATFSITTTPVASVTLVTISAVYGGVTKMATLTVNPAGNLSPVAANDTYGSTVNTILNQAAPGVLANDSDPEGATLTAQLVSGPSHGTLTLNSNGSFTYTPIANYVGSDSFTYMATDGTANSNVATVTITITSTGNVLYSDDFTRNAGAPFPLSPWTSIMGTWTVTSGTLRGSSPVYSYGQIYYAPTPLWDNYAVEGSVQYPSTAFGGGLGCRVNPATGAQYSAWIFPDNSAGGPNVLQLVKQWDWTTWSGTPMARVSLPSVGTGGHTLKLVCNGNRIQVYYDGTSRIDVTDTNFDGRSPYLSGGIGVNMWTNNSVYTTSVDNVVVTSLAGNLPPVAVNDTYTATSNTTLNQAAPGVLANDSDPEGATLTASLVSSPSHGTLTLNSSGSFTYTPIASYVGSDSFTYMATDGTNNSNIATVAITVSSGLTLNSLAVSPSGVTGGTSSVGTVTLSGPAPSGGVVVQLSSDNTLVATVPASVTVASGSTTATFTITTTQVTSSTSVTISAVYVGVTKTATLTVNPMVLSALAVSPTSITGGAASLGTVTLSGPAPSGGAVVQLSSENTSAATVPANVTVASGSTSATFTVTTYPVTSATAVTISAVYGGVTKTATLTVAVGLSTLSVSPATVTGGSASQGTVTLSGPAPSGGAVVSLSDDSSAAGEPVSVTVASGSTSATFTITTTPVASSTPVSVSAVYGGVTKTATLTVNPPIMSTFTVSPTSVTGGTASQGTVTLSGPAPSGGVVVQLSSDNTSAATVPTSVTVASGATSATFTITTTPVASSASATVSAVCSGVTKTAALTVNPPVLSTLTANPTSVTGGTSSQGTVTLSGPAPSGGTVVQLSSDNTSAATVPTTVTVASGATSATFTITTTPVASSASVTVSAVCSGVTKTAALTVNPPVLSTLTANPTSVTGGTSSVGTVTLSGPAPSGGAVVQLSSDNASAANVPVSVTIPSGSTSATFAITTTPVASAASATISAVYGVVTKTVTVTVNPPVLSTLTVSPSSVTGGAASQGTVTLRGLAPSGGAIVSLSDNSTAASEPATVTVPGGSTNATFTITTTPVTRSTTATITATFLGVAKTASLRVNRY